MPQQRESQEVRGAWAGGRLGWLQREGWAGGAGWGASRQGLEPRMLVCDPASLSPSPPLLTSLPVFLGSMLSHLPDLPNHNLTVLLRIKKHPQGNKSSRGHPVLPFQAAAYFVLANSSQAVPFLWRNSPVFFTYLCCCPHRCHLVCDLSGPQLTPPDGCPPGAGR